MIPLWTRGFFFLFNFNKKDSFWKYFLSEKAYLPSVEISSLNNDSNNNNDSKTRPKTWICCVVFGVFFVLSPGQARPLTANKQTNKPAFKFFLFPFYFWYMLSIFCCCCCCCSVLAKIVYFLFCYIFYICCIVVYIAEIEDEAKAEKQ